MMHTQERYFANEKNNELIDRISEGLLITVLHNAPLLLKNPKDYNARAELMWASSLSHNGLTGTGRVGDFACHKIEHELGGMFDVNHGAGLAAIWGSWAVMFTGITWAVSHNLQCGLWVARWIMTPQSVQH